QRLDDRIGDDELEPRHLIQQRVGLGVDARGAQVIPDAIAQGAGLPDVDRVAIRVEVQIDSGLLGQPGNLILEFVDSHTVLSSRFRTRTYARFQTCTGTLDYTSPVRSRDSEAQDVHRPHRRRVYVPAARDHQPVRRAAHPPEYADAG